MVLQSSQGLPELLFYTKKSYRILQLQFQLQFYKGTHTAYELHPSTYNLHVHTTSTSREFSIQNTILHAEDKELFEYHYYITEGKETFITDSRNSTHRRQGDLLEMHPCDIPGIPAASPYKGNSSYSNCSRDIPCLSRHSNPSRHSRDIPDIPVIHDLPAFPGNSTNSTSSSISRDSTPFQHSPTRMHILQFLQILQFDWFPQKTPPSTS